VRGGGGEGGRGEEEDEEEERGGRRGEDEEEEEVLRLRGYAPRAYCVPLAGPSTAEQPGAPQILIDLLASVPFYFRPRGIPAEPSHSLPHSRRRRRISGAPRAPAATDGCPSQSGAAPHASPSVGRACS